MSNWWSKKLSQDRDRRDLRSESRPMPTPPPRPPVEQPREAPTESPTAPHYRRPPQSSLQENHCPGCGSTNYMAPPGTQAKRCFDCGYPIQQSGSGLGSVSGQTDGTVKKSTQVPTQGYSPTTIVGKVE